MRNKIYMCKINCALYKCYPASLQIVVRVRGDRINSVTRVSLKLHLTRIESRSECRFGTMNEA